MGLNKLDFAIIALYLIGITFSGLFRGMHPYRKSIALRRQ
jgi:hypothetical protein